MDSKTEAAPQAAKATKPDAMFPVRLLRNYMPAGGTGPNNEKKVVGRDYEIVEASPSPFPGVHQAHKLWAGTIVKLPRAEAAALIDHKVHEPSHSKDSRGEPVVTMVSRRMPLAERADDIEI